MLRVPHKGEAPTLQAWAWPAGAQSREQAVTFDARIDRGEPDRQLRHARRYVLLAMFVFAVVIVPSGDPFSPTAMTVVAYPLYEFTIWMVARYERSKAAA